jgi:hypothetical protein
MNYNFGTTASTYGPDGNILIAWKNNQKEEKQRKQQENKSNLKSKISMARKNLWSM